MASRAGRALPETARPGRIMLLVARHAVAAVVLSLFNIPLHAARRAMAAAPPLPKQRR